MKKFFAFFIVLALTVGFVVAEELSSDTSGDVAGDESIGIATGLEFGVIGANKPNDAEDVYPYLEAVVKYGNSFLDKTLDVYAGLIYDIDLSNNEDTDVVLQLLTVDLKIGYNLGLDDSSTLSFIAENMNKMTLAPQEDNDDFGMIKPGIGFNRGLDLTGTWGMMAEIYTLRLMLPLRTCTTARKKMPPCPALTLPWDGKAPLVWDLRRPGMCCFPPISCLRKAAVSPA